MQRLTTLNGVRLAYPDAPFFNEITFEVSARVDGLISAAAKAGLHLGVNVSDRVEGPRQLLKMSFFDEDLDLDLVASFLIREDLRGESGTNAARRPSLRPSCARNRSASPISRKASWKPTTRNSVSSM